MKAKYLIIILISISWFKSYSQNFESYGKTKYYEFTVPTFVENIETQSKILADEKLIFTVIKIQDDGNSLIQFWKWPEVGTTNDQKSQIFRYKVYDSLNKNLNDVPNNYKIFSISNKDLESNAIPYYNAGLHRGSLDWSSGLVILPIKTRKSPDFTFSKDLTLGISGGGKLRLSHRNPTFINFLLNVGISSVTIDDKTSNGKILTPSEHASYTTALGLVLENHSFQFGLFWGKDQLTKNDKLSTSWIYDNKGWLSLGIGYQLFKSNSSTQDPKAGSQK